MVQFYNPYNRYGVSAARAGMSAFGTIPFAGNPFRTGAMGGFSKRGATQTLVTSKRRKTSKNNSFRGKLLAQEPAKHYSFGSLTALTHNTIFTLCPTAGITQGDGNTNRDGDYADLMALKIKGFFVTSAVSNCFSYRILVGYSGEEYNLPTILGSGLGASEIFLPDTTTVGWVPNGIVNPKTFTCLYDQTIDINSLVATTSDLQSFSFTVPLNKKFPYQAAASVFGKDKNLYVVVIGAVNGGSAGVTATGSVDFSYDLIFKSI